jgi:hypothetical protein
MRRRKNRKRVDGAMISGPLAGILGLACAVALSYLWIQNRCEMIGRDLRKLENEKSALVKNLHNEEYRWTELKSPRNIEKALRKWNLEMGWPTAAQVVRVKDLKEPLVKSTRVRAEPAATAGGDSVL